MVKGGSRLQCCHNELDLEKSTTGKFYSWLFKNRKSSFKLKQMNDSRVEELVLQFVFGLRTIIMFMFEQMKASLYFYFYGLYLCNWELYKDWDTPKVSLFIH